MKKITKRWGCTILEDGGRFRGLRAYLEDLAVRESKSLSLVLSEIVEEHRNKSHGPGPQVYVDAMDGYFGKKLPWERFRWAVDNTVANELYRWSNHYIEVDRDHFKPFLSQIEKNIKELNDSVYVLRDLENKRK